MANANNRNGRFYDKERVGFPSVEAYNTNFVKEGRAIGETEHPEYPMPKISNAVVFIKDPLHWVKDDAYGKLQVLNNQHGQIIASLAEAGYNLGVSTRGLGLVDKRNKIDYVRPGYLITAVDVVGRPSGQTCYVNAIYESVEWENVGGEWKPKNVNGGAYDKVIDANRDNTEFKRMFAKAMSILGTKG